MLPGGLVPALLFVVLPATGGTVTLPPCGPSVAGGPVGGGSVLVHLGSCTATTTHTLLPVAGAAGVVLLAALVFLPLLTALYLNTRRHTTHAHLLGRLLGVRRAAAVTPG